MKRKSIAQEYYILAADKNGIMPPMRRDESNAGLVTAAFMDLVLSKVIAVEKKKITVVKEMPMELGHLDSVYTYLREKPRTTEKLMSDFYYGSRINELLADIGESLLTDGAAVRGEAGFLKPKHAYIPKEGCKDELVKVLKSAITLNEQSASHDTALICILQTTKNLHQYFSKDEREDLKTRLREIRKDPQNKQLADMVNYIDDCITILMACWIICSAAN